MDPLEFDESLRYLWDWFGEVNAARSGNGFGMNLLSFSEIEAWQRLSGRALAPWEVDVLKRLDVLCLTTQTKKHG